MSFNISGVPGATEKLWYALEASPQALRGNVLGFAISTIFLEVMTFQNKRSFFCGHPVCPISFNFYGEHLCILINDMDNKHFEGLKGQRNLASGLVTKILWAPPTTTHHHPPHPIAFRGSDWACIGHIDALSTRVPRWLIRPLLVTAGVNPEPNRKS